MGMDARLIQKYAVPLDTYAADLKRTYDVRLRMQELRRKYEQEQRERDVSHAQFVQDGMRTVREKIEQLELADAEEKALVAAYESRGYDESKLESLRRRMRYVAEGGREVDEKKEIAALISEVFRAWKGYWMNARDVADKKYKNLMRWKHFYDKLTDEERGRRESLTLFEEKKRNRSFLDLYVSKQPDDSDGSRQTRTPSPEQPGPDSPDGLWS